MKRKKRYSREFLAPRFGLAAVVGRMQTWGIKRDRSLGGIDRSAPVWWKVKSLQD